MSKKAWMILLLLVVFVPLGLLSSYPAWGEWENDYYKEKIGYVPSGIEKTSGFEIPVPDYTIAGMNDTLAYYISALIGIGVIFAFYFLLMKFFVRKQHE
jgi:putative flippase GtrA